MAHAYQPPNDVLESGNKSLHKKIKTSESTFMIICSCLRLSPSAYKDIS